MSRVNETANLGLSQFQGDDHPTWLGDYNDDMAKIDAGYKENKDAIEELDTAQAGVITRVSAAEAGITAVQSDVTDIKNDVIAQNVNIDQIHHEAAQNAQDIANLGGSVTDVQADVAAVESDVLDVKSSTVELAGQVATVGGEKFYFDKHDGQYGYNTSETRGADTFHPFKTGGDVPTDLEPVLLWSNPNPTAAFAAQKVELDLSEYAGVLISGSDNSKKESGSAYKDTTCYIKKNETKMGLGSVYDTNNYASGRIVSVDENGVTFTANTSDANNSKLVPIEIYGVKKYVVEPVSGIEVENTEQDWGDEFKATPVECNVGDYYLTIFSGNPAPVFTGALDLGKLVSSTSTMAGSCRLIKTTDTSFNVDADTRGKTNPRYKKLILN